MTDMPAPPALSAAERQVAETLLAEAWGERAEIHAADALADRRHVFRLHAGPGRSAVLKRRDGQDRGGFGSELAALGYLKAMPGPVAPRLLGADAGVGILLMEDLGAGGSLAGSLLGADRTRAEADLVAYARALASMHAWSMRRPAELAGLRARHAPAAALLPEWLDAIEAGGEAFLGVAGRPGLAAGGAAEISGLKTMLGGAGYLGLVHGDACPDNVHLIDGGCRIFDFETSGWGPVVLDAAYLLAPFPSCWCFARLPAAAAAPAIAAYRAGLEAAGVVPGPDWDAATAAALIGWIIARGRAIAAALEQDREWGTTTTRPRLLAWLRAFLDTAGRAGVLPRLQALAGAMHDRLAACWPGTVIPDYPALAGPGSVPLSLPDWWQPEG